MCGCGLIREIYISAALVILTATIVTALIIAR
jgi:hypothetical protein